MAHAEASARTVDAAVTAAAAQLGLRSDQVDVEVLEEPVPSTFGFIGSPARVRVTPRTRPSSIGADPGEPADSGSGPAGVRPQLHATDHASAQEHSTEANDSNEAAAPSVPSSASATPPALAPPPATATEAGNGQVLADHSTQSTGQLPVQTQESPSSFQEGPGSAESGPASAPAVAAPAAPPAAVPEAAAPAAGPASAASAASLSTPAAVSVPETASDAPSATPFAAAPREEPGSSARGTRQPRRTYKDEPIEPQMVEEDTERAGDFLEGLLDALDVDGDITTWVDEVGGHIDLEGTDLEGLVGPNGETLDALQELTRLAVLRQSKRRVRLLIDINGFRARQREQLTSMVRAAVEQVIHTREDHELEPMTPAERKIVHDAVAAIEGARTESLGEEPNRRVVIRPA